MKKGAFNLNISRRRFLLASAALSSGLLLPAKLFAGNKPAAMPNFILCMSDDQGWGDTGYNGHPVLRTPHIDAMAIEGLQFDRFYSGGPVCSPTRGSSLTGRHPQRYGILSANIGHMKREECTIAEILKTKGYSTGHFGKWHLGTLTTKIKDGNRGRPGVETDYSPPWENGFDVCFSTESKVPTWDPMIHPETGEPFGTRYWIGPDRYETDNLNGDDSRIIMDRVIPFIKDAVSNEDPFLAVIWFHAPHKPVKSGPPFTDGYSENRDYYGSLTAMDFQIGRLRQELARLNVDNNTMFWFCSDNGPEDRYKGTPPPGSTKGLRGWKRTLYEGGIRVPATLVWPAKIKQHVTVSMPCSTSDYVPTIMDVIGGQSKKCSNGILDGISLLPLLNGELSERPEPIAFEYLDQLALVDNRYKIYSSNKGETFELYDLLADPSERKNIIKEKPGIFLEMKAYLDKWRESWMRSAEGKDYI